ncbi:MAG: cupin domain-containing protein [Flammeovirgaceae bacterium]|nr:cupin domain-containing protein [Flammeovirgaceae bacterium]
MKASYWIEKLELIAHPEGGYFKETYKSKEEINKDALPARYSGDRAFSTAIYFLLKGDEFSAFHRIASDEIWHFYAGTSVSIHMILPDGKLQIVSVGPNIEDGENFQGVIPAGAWFGAKVNEPNSYTLVGCTVAPGFDFADFELAKESELLELFPQHTALIKEMSIH